MIRSNALPAAASLSCAPPPHITGHAIMRFQERVQNLPEAEVRTLLSCRAVQAAIAFGCEHVRLATGHRLVIDNGAVVTVLPSNPKNKRFPRFRKDEGLWI